MRYKDKNFLKFQEKQRYAEPVEKDRKLRREVEFRFLDFYRKKIYKRVEREWWDCLSSKDKDSIIKSYDNQKSMLDRKYNSRGGRIIWWSNFTYFETWDEWFDYIHSEYKPNRIKYRESKLKKLGI